ncbi:ribose/xylose/arabinose/galactoside ABC transporters, permease components [Microcella alkaliphila]|uniref:Autoinducer 2 import system permease protein LsrD n=2 Tax=Microcella alkaliphila TaxID=279828 RepID=A0A0U4WTL9_9MICO|nr:ribose/xylose/arabinose/galactoside ABC transporters, permease components [Microcella alkaliphila]
MTELRTVSGPRRTMVPHGRPLWRRAVLTREGAVIGMLAVVIVVALTTVPNFDSPLTITFLLRDVAPILLIALPMTLIIITEEIDLSVASVVALSSVTVGILTRDGAPFELAMVAGVLVGAVAGTINGFLVTVVGLPSLAVTIGSLAMFRGISVGLLGTQAVTDFPEEWTSLARSNIPGTPIPSIMIAFVILAIIFGVVLHATPFGRSLYAIGLNKEAAHFSGVNVGRTKFILFVASGTVSGFAGVYFTLLYGNARGENATGMELAVIAAVLLGGVSIFGGRGALHGVIAGVLLIGTIGSALRLAGVTADIINVITGVVLVLSVVSASFLAWFHRARATARARGEKQG